jgi:Family of unknown function (DUF5636)
MAFLDETLALAAPPPAGQAFVPGLNPTASVIDRIPQLARAPDAFTQFLEQLSAFLQPAFPLDWDSDFGKGLIYLETQLRETALRRSRQLLGREMPLDELATALDPNGATRDQGVKQVVGGLLSGVLTDIENDYLALPGGARSRAITLNGFVDPTDFRTRLIKLGRTWKDVSVPWTHGEFTHRIQWCAAMAFFRNPAWSANYMLTGAYEDAEAFGFDAAKDEWPTFGLWDAIVDRNPFRGGFQVPYLSAGQFDFRSPENLQGWIETAKQPLSPIRLLATFIVARADKRFGQKRSRVPAISTALPTWDQWKVWCRRLLGNDVDLEQLPPERKGVLGRAWVRLTLLDAKGPINPILVIEPEDEAPRVQPSYQLKRVYKSLRLTLLEYNAFPIPGP